MTFAELHTNYPHFFDHLEVIPPSDSDKDPKYHNSFIMSIDAEWYEYGGRNVVLSYQIATASRTKTNNIIIYMEHKVRLTLAEIIAAGIKSITTAEEYAALNKSRTIAIIISHNMVAEWSTLLDRDEPHITKRLTVIRNSPITDFHPIKLFVDNVFPVHVKFFDTMLLSPGTHRSLKSLSSLLGDKEKEKDPITQFYIEHMNLYLRDHPEKYRAYALKDSDITLRLFFLLQQYLNQLVGGDTFKLYRTLASAGVKSFLIDNEWYKEYRDIRKSDKFYKAYQLVKRSYYGGRNESYFIGRTSDYEESKNKIWIDIDLSGCYPTAMALCPQLDMDGDVDYIPYRHELTDEKVANLIKQKIDKDVVIKARDALRESPEAFDQALSEINSITAWKIRKEATVIDYWTLDFCSVL